jgi:hypothetical protein
MFPTVNTARTAIVIKAIAIHTPNERFLSGNLLPHFTQKDFAKGGFSNPH